MVFGVVVAAAAFAAAEVARRATTHAWRAARITGVTLGALCLVYLTLWWRTANAGFGWSAPAWTAFALAVAVAISLLLGHAVSITTLALIARASDGAALEPRARRSFWRLTAPLGLVAFLGAGVLLLSTTPERADAAAAPDFAVVPTGAAVTVVAIDGFDAALARQLVEGGALPHLAALERAARARLAPQTSTDPAPVWTTIATGQPPSVHGVTGLETRRVAGVQGAVAASRSPLVEALAAATDLVRLTRPAVASADERREKTFWEVAAGKGLRTAVVNWWATWPAPKGAGIVVTDRAPIRLERGGTLDAEIAPPALYEHVPRRVAGDAGASPGPRPRGVRRRRRRRRARGAGALRRARHARRGDGDEPGARPAGPARRLPARARHRRNTRCWRAPARRRCRLPPSRDGWTRWRRIIGSWTGWWRRSWIAPPRRARSSRS